MHTRNGKTSEFQRMNADCCDGTETPECNRKHHILLRNSNLPESGCLETLEAKSRARVRPKNISKEDALLSQLSELTKVLIELKQKNEVNFVMVLSYFFETDF